MKARGKKSEIEDLKIDKFNSEVMSAVLKQFRKGGAKLPIEEDPQKLLDVVRECLPADSSPDLLYELMRNANEMFKDKLLEFIQEKISLEASADFLSKHDISKNPFKVNGEFLEDLDQLEHLDFF